MAVVNREVTKISKQLARMADKMPYTGDVDDCKNMKQYAKDGKLPRCGYFGSVTDAAIQRLAFRAGCSRIGSDVYATVRSCLSNFLATACDHSDVLSYSRNKSNNVTEADVLYALKLMNVNIYGLTNTINQQRRASVGGHGRKHLYKSFADMPIKCDSFEIYFDVIEHSESDPDNFFPGLKSWRKDHRVPKKSEWELVTSPGFSYERTSPTVDQLDAQLQLIFVKLIKCYYGPKANTEISEADRRRQSTLVGYMIVRPWDPFTTRKDQIARETGLSVTTALRTNMDEQQQNEHNEIWRDANFKRLMDDLEVSFFDANSNHNDNIAKTYKYSQFTFGHRAWPRKNIVRHTDDPAEFFIDDDSDEEKSGSLISPTYMHVDRTDRTRERMERGRHWLPRGVTKQNVLMHEFATEIGKGFMTSDNKAFNLVSSLHYTNTKINVDNTPMRYIIEIVDYSFRTFYNKQEDKLEPYIKLDDFVSNDTALQKAFAETHVRKYGQDENPFAVMTDDKNNYFNRCRWLSKASTVSQFGHNGGFIQSVNNNELRRVISRDKFLKVHLRTKPNNDPEFVLPVTGPNWSYVWRPIEIPEIWQTN